ncbi:S-layer homology domain-containing protein [Candidatus Peregrinibacteria bacterium]|nr:S-layer homology domain-containing protein [Candidatus Peregrinibacteria bacterium]
MRHLPKILLFLLILAGLAFFFSEANLFKGGLSELGGGDDDDGGVIGIMMDGDDEGIPLEAAPAEMGRMVDLAMDMIADSKGAFELSYDELIELVEGREDISFDVEKFVDDYVAVQAGVDFVGEAAIRAEDWVEEKESLSETLEAEIAEQAEFVGRLEGEEKAEEKEKLTVMEAEQAELNLSIELQSSSVDLIISKKEEADLLDAELQLILEHASTYFEKPLLSTFELNGERIEYKPIEEEKKWEAWATFPKEDGGEISFTPVTAKESDDSIDFKVEVSGERHVVFMPTAFEEEAGFNLDAEIISAERTLNLFEASFEQDDDNDSDSKFTFVVSEEEVKERDFVAVTLPLNENVEIVLESGEKIDFIPATWIKETADPGYNFEVYDKVEVSEKSISVLQFDFSDEEEEKESKWEFELENGGEVSLTPVELLDKGDDFSVKIEGTTALQFVPKDLIDNEEGVIVFGDHKIPFDSEIELEFSLQENFILEKDGREIEFVPVVLEKQEVQIKVELPDKRIVAFIPVEEEEKEERDKYFSVEPLDLTPREKINYEDYHVEIYLPPEEKAPREETYFFNVEKKDFSEEFLIPIKYEEEEKKFDLVLENGKEVVFVPQTFLEEKEEEFSVTITEKQKTEIMIIDFGDDDPPEYNFPKQDGGEVSLIPSKIDYFEEFDIQLEPGETVVFFPNDLLDDDDVEIQIVGKDEIPFQRIDFGEKEEPSYDFPKKYGGEVTFVPVIVEEKEFDFDLEKGEKAIFFPKELIDEDEPKMKLVIERENKVPVSLIDFGEEEEKGEYDFPKKDGGKVTFVPVIVEEEDDYGLKIPLDDGGYITFIPKDYEDDEDFPWVVKIPEGEIVEPRTPVLLSVADEPEVHLFCESLALTYEELASDETELEVEIEIIADGEEEELSILPQWFSSAFEKVWVFLASDEEELWNGILRFETSGSGYFSENDISLSGALNNLSISYYDAAEGDVLDIFIVGEDAECGESIVVSKAAPAEVGDEGEEDEILGLELPDDDELGDEDEEPVGEGDGEGDDEGEEEEGEELGDSDEEGDGGEIGDGGEEDELVEDGDGDEDEELTDLDVCDEHSFTDVSGHFSEAYITLLYCRNVVNGRTPVKFVPNDNVQISEVIKMLVLSAGFTTADAVGHGESFPDVHPTDWYYPYVVIAENEGMLDLPAFSRLNPESDADRRQVVVWAARLAEKEYHDWTADDIPWSDLRANDPGAYAFLLAYNDLVYVEGIGWVRVVEGYQDGTVRPDNFITRGEVTTMINRITEAWFDGVW